MAATRTPGITIDAAGNYFIDKRYRGVRIGMRVSAMTQEQVEKRLQAEMRRVDLDLARALHRRPTFADCAARYLFQCREFRSLEAIRVHVRMLLPHIGQLLPHQVHDATLMSFVAERLSAGASLAQPRSTAASRLCGPSCTVPPVHIVMTTDGRGSKPYHR